MIRTIVITDNDDNTQSVRFFNVNNEGDNVIVNKGKVEYDISRDIDRMGNLRAEINLKVKCFPDHNNIMCKITTSTSSTSSSIEDYSSEELIKELKSRNILLEEIVYKVKI